MPHRGHRIRVPRRHLAIPAPGTGRQTRQFIREYQTVRRAEGRGSDDPAYYRALPFFDRTGLYGRLGDTGQKLRMLVRQVLSPREAR